MSDLVSQAHALCLAVDGVDWRADVVQHAIVGIHTAWPEASPDEREAAMEALVARLARARLDDADGIAHLAITGGALVESGASPRAFGEAMLAALPSVLEAARRFANQCLAGVDPEEERVAEEDTVGFIDGVPIARARFQAHLADDRVGACAVAYLREWVLPTVACLTRDRALLARFTRDERLVGLAAALGESEASWLTKLASTQLDAPWRVVCVDVGRAFEVRVDGVCSNFELHALVADALVERGVPGNRNPRDVLDVVRGLSDEAERTYVEGVFEMFVPAALEALTRPERQSPLKLTVWNEGAPTDVPVFEGRRTVLVTAPVWKRTWNGGRPFSALRAAVTVERELSGDEHAALLARMRDAATAGSTSSAAAAGRSPA
jgi:hypothetical protein